MGPVTVFDKSFLQSLNVDESVWFNHFYLCNICPLFYIETLSDLEKEMKNGRTPEEVVGSIAYKFPESGSPNVFHEKACLTNLMGNQVPMYGQILIPSGMPVKKDDRKGIVVKPSPEIEAFHRWQSHKFLEVEHFHAREWRSKINSIELHSLTDLLIYFPLKYDEVNSPEEAKILVDEYISNPKYIKMQLYLLFRLSNIPQRYYPTIFSRWQASGMKSIVQYAPYAAYTLSVDLVFIISLYRGFVSDQRPSNRTDVNYIKYIPFSHVFVSNDKLHRMLAPLFLNDRQTFIWGNDLKNDLHNLNEYFLAFPQEVKSKGLHYFASSPPYDDQYLTTTLWKKYLNNALIRDNVFHEPEKRPELIKEMSKYDEINASEGNIDFQRDPDFMLIKHKVSKKKGSWQVIPEDI